MIIGSLSGSLCAGGGFCVGSTDIVEHQRISSAAYTFSAALPAMAATTASETIQLLQEHPEYVRDLRDNTKVMRGQLDGRSDFMYCTSAIEVPICVLIVKDEIVAARGWGREETEMVLQEVVDECLANGVLITRMKRMPLAIGVAPRDQGWQSTPAIKVCVTTGLTKKEVEKAGTVIRHAIAKMFGRKR